MSLEVRPAVHPKGIGSPGGSLARLVLLLAVLAIACRPPGYRKGDDPPAETDAAVITPDAPPIDGPAGATCAKAFRLDGHSQATTVWLTGSFVMWGGDPAHGAIELVKGIDGAWTGSYDFSPGQVQYKYIVDTNNWINDPTNPNTADDGFGGHNSVFTCAP